MRQLTEQEIRQAMVNCTRGEATTITLPPDFARLDWDSLDYLGWRDPKSPRRGYIVYHRDDAPVGIVLRAPDSTGSRRINAMCSLCRTGRSGEEVALFVARRTGRAGREANTVGTYVCADLACSRMVREGAVHSTPEQRIDGLRARLDAFVSEVLRG